MTSARALLASTDIEPREAEVLLLDVLAKDRAWLYAHGDEPLDDRQRARFEVFARRRQAGEPVAYILGKREFWSLPLTVNPAVLIPRPDTELLVRCAIDVLTHLSAPACLDLGTGSGAVALAIKSDLEQCRVTALDCSPEALAVARANGEQLGLAIEWLQSDWFAALGDRRWPLIVSNPPYIRANDQHLQQGDLPAEPQSALVAGEDGLDCIRSIVGAAPLHLEAGGTLLFEHGWDQALEVRALLKEAGFVEVHTQRDLAGHERVTGGRWP